MSKSYSQKEMCELGIMIVAGLIENGELNFPSGISAIAVIETLVATLNDSYSIKEVKEYAEDSALASLLLSTCLIDPEEIKHQSDEPSYYKNKGEDVTKKIRDFLDKHKENKTSYDFLFEKDNYGNWKKKD